MPGQEAAYERVTMTAKEAAEYLGISLWLCYELVKRKQIPAVKVASRVLFRKQSLDRYMEAQEAKSMGQEQPERGKLRVVGQ